MNRIVVFGTFDIFHDGHENFFKQVKNRGGYLLVVVARDKFVKESKGKFPSKGEELRVKNVRKSDFPDKVILGSKTHNFFRTLRTYKIDSIALGYDQKPTIGDLKKSLKRHRLPKVKVKRMRPYKPHIYKSRLLVK